MCDVLIYVKKILNSFSAFIEGLKNIYSIENFRNESCLRELLYQTVFKTCIISELFLQMQPYADSQ